MARTARGDRDAFALVYARHAQALMTFLAHSLGDRSAAEDLCQETFVRAWRASPRFRADAPLRPWLFRITRNLVSTELRRRRLSRSGLTRWFSGRSRSTEAAVTDSIPSALSESAPRLRSAIQSLAEVLRSAFVLVRIEGLSYDDAAQLLDVPVGTVKSRTAAAEAELRRALSSPQFRSPKSGHAR